MSKTPFLGLLLLLTVLSGCTLDSTKPEVQQQKQSPATVRAPSPAQRTEPSATYAFDVPALMGKTIAQVDQQLGKPLKPDTPNLTVDEVERKYYHKGYTLIATYNTKSKAVTSFMIPAPERLGETNNIGKLLAAGHIDPTTQAYRVDSLAGNEDGYYVGVLVSPD